MNILEPRKTYKESYKMCLSVHVHISWNEERKVKINKEPIKVDSITHVLKLRMSKQT